MIKRRFLKILSVLAAIIVAGGVCAAGNIAHVPLALDVGAAYEEYGMTKAYKAGRYYTNLVSLELSGDQSRDVIAVALSQLGYHEGDSNEDFGGEKTEGTKDFVEYNVLFGKLDNDQGNGLSYGYYWCASFVNWCFRQADIPEDATAGAEVSCQRWINDCKKQGIYVQKGGYIPKEGDMVFFKDKGSSADSTHIGLVLYSDGNRVYTVEGNTSNGSEYSSNGEYVALKSHSLSSSYIVGYAAPKYTKNKSAHRVDRSGGLLTKGQYISTDSLSVFDDADRSDTSTKTISDHTVFTVTEVNGDTLKVSYNDSEGYVKMTDGTVQINTHENVYRINYLSENGQMLFTPQYCISGQEKSIYANTPKREKSGFVGWKISDSDELLSPGDSLGKITHDVTLTSVWDDNYYVVTFKSADGKVISQTHGYYGAEYEIPEAPEAPEGTLFAGWGEEVDGTIRGNASYTAVFAPQEETETETAETESPAIETASETESDANKTDRGCLSSVSGAAMLLSSIIGACSIICKKKK